MKEYFVTLPATVALNIRVEVESIDDAIEKSLWTSIWNYDQK